MKPDLYKVHLTLQDRHSYDRLYGYLAGLGLEHHLLAIYFNDDAGIVVVLNNRDAAIMLKLALG